MSVVKNNKTIECVWKNGNVSTFGVKDGKVFYMNGTSIMNNGTTSIGSDKTHFFFDERNLYQRGYGNYNTTSPVPGNYFTRDTFSIYSTKGVGYFPEQMNTFFQSSKITGITATNMHNFIDNDYAQDTLSQDNTSNNRAFLADKMRYTIIANHCFKFANQYQGYTYIPGAVIKSPNGDIYYHKTNGTAGVYCNYMWENSTHKDETYATLGGNYPVTIGRAAFTWAVGTWWNMRNPTRVAFEGRNTVGVSNLTFSSNVRSVWIFNNANIRLVTPQYDAVLNRGMFEGQTLDFFGRTYLNFNEANSSASHPVYLNNMFRDAQIWTRAGNGFQIVNNFAVTGSAQTYFYPVNMFQNAAIYGNTTEIFLDQLLTGMSQNVQNRLYRNTLENNFAQNSNLSFRNMIYDYYGISGTFPFHTYYNHRGVIDNMNCNILYMSVNEMADSNHTYNILRIWERANCIRNSRMRFWETGITNNYGQDVRHISLAKFYNSDISFSCEYAETGENINRVNFGTTHYAFGGCILDNCKASISNITGSLAYTFYGTTIRNKTTVQTYASMKNNNKWGSTVCGRCDYMFRNAVVTDSSVTCNWSTRNQSATVTGAGAGMFWNAKFTNSSLKLPSMQQFNYAFRSLVVNMDNQDTYLLPSMFKNCWINDSIIEVGTQTNNWHSFDIRRNDNWTFHIAHNNFRLTNSRIIFAQNTFWSTWQNSSELFRYASIGPLTHPYLSVYGGNYWFHDLTFEGVQPTTRWTPSWFDFRLDPDDTTALLGTFITSSISCFYADIDTTLTASRNHAFLTSRTQYFGPSIRAVFSNTTIFSSNANINNYLNNIFNDKANWRLQRDLIIACPWNQSSWAVFQNNTQNIYNSNTSNRVDFANMYNGTLARWTAGSTWTNWYGSTSGANYCNSIYNSTRKENASPDIIVLNTANRQIDYYVYHFMTRMSDIYRNIIFIQQNAGNWTATNF